MGQWPSDVTSDYQCLEVTIRNSGLFPEDYRWSVVRKLQNVPVKFVRRATLQQSLHSSLVWRLSILRCIPLDCVCSIIGVAGVALFVVKLPLEVPQIRLSEDCRITSS